MSYLLSHPFLSIPWSTTTSRLSFTYLNPEELQSPVFSTLGLSPASIKRSHTAFRMTYKQTNPSCSSLTKVLWWLSNDFRTASSLLELAYKMHIYSCSKYILSVYYLSSTIIEAEASTVNETFKTSILMKYLFQWERQTVNKINKLLSNYDEWYGEK